MSNTKKSSTKCLGRDEPQAIERLDTDGFQKVLELYVLIDAKTCH
jgi:hypothetical protein